MPRSIELLPRFRETRLCATEPRGRLARPGIGLFARPARRLSLSLESGVDTGQLAMRLRQLFARSGQVFGAKLQRPLQLLDLPGLARS